MSLTKCVTHEVLVGLVCEQLVLYIKGAGKFVWKKICLCLQSKWFIGGSNSGKNCLKNCLFLVFTGTILDYTNGTGPNQSGSSWNRHPWTHNTVYA